MLDQKDLKAIGSLMDEKIKSNNKDLGIIMDEKIKSNNKDLGIIMDEKIKSNNQSNNKEIIGMIGEMLEQNIIPRIDALERTVSTLPTKEYIDQKIANLPDKQYLDDKIADAMSEVGTRFVKRDGPDREFKATVTEIIEEHDLATPKQRSILKKSISLQSPLTAQSV